MNKRNSLFQILGVVVADDLLDFDEDDLELLGLDDLDEDELEIFLKIAVIVLFLFIAVIQTTFSAGP